MPSISGFTIDFRRRKAIDAASQSEGRVLARKSPKCLGKQQGWNAILIVRSLIRIPSKLGLTREPGCAAHVSVLPALLATATFLTKVLRLRPPCGGSQEAA